MDRRDGNGYQIVRPLLGSPSHTARLPRSVPRCDATRSGNGSSTGLSGCARSNARIVDDPVAAARLGRKRTACIADDGFGALASPSEDVGWQT